MGRSGSVKVTVNLVGSLRSLAGEALTSFEVKEGSNLKNVLSDLGAKYPRLLEALAISPRTTLILINGVEIGNLQGTESIISPNTIITMLPVIHGG
ncbi:MAG: MoaD/ThiS family protein [Candidatus Bathyarchaeota archaeon]|nr:MoaD/ThiS family protein [Candidatus Bathyarchaeota archaeon]